MKRRNYLRKKTIKVKGIKIPKIFFILVFLIFITNIAFGIETSSYTAELVNLEKQEQEIIRANRTVSSETIQSSSLKELYDQASEYGFHKPLSVVYITKEEVVAKLP